MDRHQCDTGLADLERRFSKKYTDAQRDAIWETVAHWPTSQWDAILHYMRGNSRYLPSRPVDFDNALRTCPKARSSPRNRFATMAGNCEGDSGRAVRIGRMMAVPDAHQRAYARRLVSHMNVKDSDEAKRAYNEVPLEIRMRCEREDTGPEGEDAQRTIDDEAHAVYIARHRADQSTREETFIPPMGFSEYLRRYKKKRGDDYKVTRIGIWSEENCRIHREILEDVEFGTPEVEVSTVPKLDGPESIGDILGER